MSIELFDPGLQKTTCLGSGVFYIGRSGVVMGLTNAHVVSNVLPTHILFMGYNLNDSNKIYFNARLTKIDKQLDLCLLTVSGLISKDYKNLDPKNVVLDSTRFLTKTNFAEQSNILIGSEVLYVGYPLYLGSLYKLNKPLYRKGCIAQVNLNENDFVINGIGYPGNSGSAIFDLSSNQFLGLIKSRSEEFSILRITDTSEIRIPINSGLINCISSVSVLKFLGDFQ